MVIAYGIVAHTTLYASLCCLFCSIFLAILIGYTANAKMSDRVVAHSRKIGLPATMMGSSGAGLVIIQWLYVRLVFSHYPEVVVYATVTTVAGSILCVPFIAPVMYHSWKHYHVDHDILDDIGNHRTDDAEKPFGDHRMNHIISSSVI